MRVVCLGAGRLASRLPALLPKAKLFGLSRSRPTQVSVSALEWIHCDLSWPAAKLNDVLTALGPIDAVVYTATPSSRSVSDYQHMYVDVPRKIQSLLDASRTRWIHVSSTGVFGHCHGEWVHEDTAPTPKSVIAKLLRESEQVVAGYGNSAIIRLGGIYGPSRLHLRQAIENGRQFQGWPWNYTNRIHELDASRALAWLLEHPSPGVTIYHGVDHDPAPMHQVVERIASQYDLELQPFVRLKNAHEAQQNKRVGNRALLASGFTFRFPSLIQGLSYNKLGQK